MKIDRATTSDVVAALQRSMQDVPFCTLVPADKELNPIDDEAVWVGVLRLPYRQKIVVLEAKPTGEPRIARDAVNRLLRYRQSLPDASLVFGAPYISNEATKILTEAGVGYVDLSGNCRLTFDQVYIRRDGQPNKFAERRGLRSLYSPKAERVLRTLLLDPKCRWKLEPLAKAADVSLGQVAKVKRLLEDREWVSRDAEGIALARPGELLAEWSTNYRFKRNAIRDFYSLDPLPQIESKLATTCLQLQREYALAGFSAAARMAPMVRYQRATAYVVGGIDEIAGCMGLKAVSSGANISLIEPYDEGVLAGSREIGGVRTASAVQTYLDLLSLKGRGEEAAEAILSQVIKPTW